MEKLFEVDIFGLKVPVVSEPGMLQRTGTYGYADFDKMQIVMDTDLTKQIFVRTLMHEMIHFLMFRLNIDMHETLEEQLCEVVAQCLGENLYIKIPTRLYRPSRQAQRQKPLVQDPQGSD